MLNIWVLLGTFIISFALSTLLFIWFIPILRKQKIGQKILSIGPNWHKTKEGTPTMGGVVFLIVSIFLTIVFFAFFRENMDYKEQIVLINIIVYAILNGLIGLIDDIAKMRKAKNEGLTPKMKFFLQSIAAVIFLFLMHYFAGIDTNLYIPFVGIDVDLGAFYYVIAFLILCGVVNSVNLTDGIDGLAGCVSLTVALFFMLVSLVFFKTISLGFITGILLGMILGFLIFNLYPAKIFMGDTGSLFLGGIIVSVSFLMNNILLVLIFGLVFVCEAVSDIVQVVYFKLSKGKRVFKMAPFHHHLEKCGWSENKIVLILSLVNGIFCLLALLGVRKI